MKKKMLLFAVLLVCAVFAFAGCNNTAENTTTAAENTTTAAETTAAGGEEKQTRTIVDMSGTEVEIPMEVKRIVNSWPSSNSIMLMVGAGDFLVGTSTAISKNAWAQFVYPNIVNVPTDISNLEDVMKLEPDLYIVNNSDNAQKARDAGIPAVNLTFSDYDSMKKSFAILGEILGGEYQTKLNYWGTYLDDWTNKVTEKLKDIPVEKRPLLYYVSAQSDASLTTTFKSPSICQAWATIAGCRYFNDYIDDPSATTISEEIILKQDPQVIVVGGLQQAAAMEALQANKVWAEITAVKEGKVFVSPIGVFPWPRFGIESVLMIPWLASTVYPDVFTDIDMVEVTRDFYKQFAGVELTDEQIGYMFQGVGPDGK